MPAADGTLTPEDVADWLGVVVDERVTACAEAATAHVLRLRSLSDPLTLFTDAEVHLAATKWAALEYQERSAPQGFDGVDGLGLVTDTSSAKWSIDKMIGVDPVIA